VTLLHLAFTHGSVESLVLLTFLFVVCFGVVLLRPEWIEPSCCACETQAYRIGVVVDLIRHITDRRAEEDIDDGGWRLTAPGF
jgi:hypothetical protein